MTHVRTQIRNNVDQLLKGLPTTGQNVFKSRARPLQPSELPALMISVPREPIKELGAQLQSRSAMVIVKIAVSESDGYEDQIDQIALEVEQKMAANYSLGGIAKNTSLRDFDIEISFEMQKPVAIGALVFEVQYVTPKGAPSNPM